MENQSKKQIRLSELGLFYAAAIWGSTFFIVKGALNGIDPITLVAYRFLLAGGLLLIYLLYKKKDLTKNWKQSIFLGIILWMLYIPQTIGLKYTTASNSGFITGLFVIFIPIFLLTLFRKKPTVMETAASIVSLFGLWFLTGGLHDINIGDSITLIASVTYAIHVLYTDKYVKEGTDPAILICQQFLFVGLLSLLTSIVLGLPLNIDGTSVLTATLFLAIFPTFSAFVIQGYAQKYTSPIKVSLIFAFEPLFAALFAWTLGDEQIIQHRAIGGLLIFLALIISGLPTPKFLKKK